MNNPPNDYSQRETKDSSEINIDLKQIISKFTDKWKWFATGITLCLVFAYLYARYQAPMYQVSSRLLINADSKSGPGGGVGGLMDLSGLMGGNNSVENEIEILKSRFLVEQVVKDMDLNIVYNIKGKIGTREVYQPPFRLIIEKSGDTIKHTQLELENFTARQVKVSSEEFEKEVSWNEIFKINGLALKLVPNANFKPNKGSYLVTISNIDSRVSNIMGGLSVSQVSKQVSMINLSLSYPVPRKGEDILNALIKRYTQANIGDKNAIADSTGKFIKERLAVISEELGKVENRVEGFKQQNKLADMSEQGKILVQSTGQLAKELAQAETQVSVLTELENYLKDETKNKRVFPSSLIAQDLVFSGMMNQYNALLLEREKSLMVVNEGNVLIQNIDSQLAGLRKGILGNIQSGKSAAVLTRNRLRQQLRSAEGQITGIPEIEKNYLQLARNQQIKQELYIFLMQKAEETAISKTANMSVAKIIDPPKSGGSPISPRRNIIYFAGLLVGLIVPASLILLLDFLNTSISNKQDVTNNTSVPIIGEISHNLTQDNLIVANQTRSAISEQFRALRTNLSFYLKNANEKVILLTSSMSGEGKSFTAINLGNVLALAGKKVLLMEMDLRKPGLAVKLDVNNEIGFSNYTIREDVKIEDIIKPLAVNKNMFFVSSGPLPPNPAETIMSEHTAPLIDELRKRFDYIILDAPPIGVIADAQLLAPYADVTLYLVRQNVTHKDQIRIVEDLYRSGKMKNLAIVVNDVSARYYGYGYGYGSYGEDEPTGSLNKLFKKLKR